MPTWTKASLVCPLLDILPKSVWYAHYWFRCQAWYARCSADWTWCTHGYLYPEPHLVFRLSLATMLTSWNVITSSSDFLESPVIPVPFFIIIRTVFCYCLFLFVWIQNTICIFIWIV